MISSGKTIRRHMRPANNLALSGIFHQMAACYRYLGPSERFRAIAYENASRILLNMKEDIAEDASDIHTLDAIGGIGEGLAKKIMEYLETGRVALLEELKKLVPFDLLELMDTSGIGPATIRLLHDKLGIRDRAELIAALQQQKLEGIRGFGAKKIENLQRSLKIYKPDKRLPYKTAYQYGMQWIRALKKIPGILDAQLAGSLRRKKETIGDIDVVILCHEKDRRKIVNQVEKLPGVDKVIARGLTRVSLVLKKENLQVDMRLVKEDQFGAALLYFTGSKEHNIKLRTMARRKSWKINEYGLFDNKTGKYLAGATEADIYARLGLNWIEPEKRKDEGEIEKAMVN